MSFKMTMVHSTKVSELQIFDVLVSLSSITDHSSELAPWGFLLFLRLTRHHYPPDGKLKQRLSNSSVNKIHFSVVTDWRNYLRVGEGV
jgi:hypothetical protein